MAGFSGRTMSGFDLLSGLQRKTPWKIILHPYGPDDLGQPLELKLNVRLHNGAVAHHPRTHPSSSSCRLSSGPTRDGLRLRYTAETLGGSSDAPVFKADFS